VILLDAVPSVLTSFGDRLGGKALARLDQIGVEVQLGAKVVGVDGTGIEGEDAQGRRRIESVCRVWAAGVSASPLGALLAEQSGAKLDRAGRIEVLPDLTLPGHPEVFVVGDMIALEGLPGVAQVAIQGGRYAARRIEARLAASVDGRPFEYHDKGSMATISRFSAVASIGRFRLSGFVARLPGRVQTPADHAPALGRELRRPRPFRANGHPAADLRPPGDRPARRGLHPDPVPAARARSSDLIGGPKTSVI
jgi:NADH dehydrogenase